MSKTKKIAICGMMVAISFVLDYISIKTDFTKITLYALPLIVVGIFYGPGLGALAGVCEGIISQLLCYEITITAPLWMLAPIIWGTLSGLLFKIVKTKTPIKLAISILLTALFVTFINTIVGYLDGLIMHYASEYVFTILGTRIIFSLLTSVIYYVIVLLIYNRLYSFINK